jgi:hypothetical protein
MEAVELGIADGYKTVADTARQYGTTPGRLAKAASVTIRTHEPWQYRHSALIGTVPNNAAVTPELCEQMRLFVRDADGGFGTVPLGAMTAIGADIEIDGEHARVVKSRHQEFITAEERASVEIAALVRNVRSGVPTDIDKLFEDKSYEGIYADLRDRLVTATMAAIGKGDPFDALVNGRIGIAMNRILMEEFRRRYGSSADIADLFRVLTVNYTKFSDAFRRQVTLAIQHRGKSGPAPLNFLAERVVTSQQQLRKSLEERMNTLVEKMQPFQPLERRLAILQSRRYARRAMT